MDKILAFCVIAAISLIAIVIWAAVEEKHYKQEHKCINIDEPETTFMPQYIYGSKGQLIGMYFIPITTFMYQCDNGKKRFS